VSRRKAMGLNPLDAVIPPVQPVREHNEPPGPEARLAQAERPHSTRLKTRLTVQLPAPLVEEVRDAVMFLHTCGVHTTLASLVMKALEGEMAAIRELHNHGEPLPTRGAALPPGRPIQEESASPMAIPVSK
jgi:hypothetical protein